MPQPIYAAFTGNTLKFLPLSPYREDGYKLSVENKETGDNYSSTVLEYDP